MRDMSDVSLVRRLEDPEAFTEFYERFAPRVRGFAVRRCAAPEDVADIVADVFVSVISSGHSYNPARGDVLPWLLGIASHRLADRRTAAFRAVALEQRLEGRRFLSTDDYARLEEQIDAAREAPSLRKALDDLNSGERELLDLIRHDGLSVREASQVLGITAVAGRMRLARARKKVRAALARNALQGLVAVPVPGQTTERKLG
jgi:RNA polymerase sigma-70 factor (ECF subfamily)